MSVEEEKTPKSRIVRHEREKQRTEPYELVPGIWERHVHAHLLASERKPIIETPALPEDNQLESPWYCYGAAKTMYKDGKYVNARVMIKTYEDCWKFSNINAAFMGLLWKISMAEKPNDTAKHEKLREKARRLGFHNAIIHKELEKYKK